MKKDGLPVFQAVAEKSPTKMGWKSKLRLKVNEAGIWQPEYKMSFAEAR